MINMMIRQKGFFIPICIIGLFLLLFPLFGGPYHLHVLILVFLNVTLATGYRVLYQTGLGSFGHIAFFAIGAYTSAIFCINFNLPWGICFLSGGALAALLSVALGLPTVRTRGPYFFIITFAFYKVVDTVFANWISVTGGRSGVRNIPPITGFRSVRPYYYLILVFAAMVIFLLYRLDKSRFSEELRAIGDDDRLAETVGINVSKHRITAFAIGAFVAGLAGSIFAHYLGYISPMSFSIWDNLYILIWVVIGGASQFWGPITGAAFMTLLAEGLRMSGKLEAIVYAAALFVVIMTMPEGLTGLVDTLRLRFARHKQTGETNATT